MMKHTTTFAILALGLSLATAAFARDPGSMSQRDIDGETRTIADRMPEAQPASPVSTISPRPNARLAGERFIEHVNSARVALATNDPASAKSHITQAKSMVSLVRADAAGQRPITRVQSGRIVYDTPANSQSHYFPIQVGTVEVKKLEKGPFWTKKGLAVTDAEIVYLTLDLKGNKAETYLNEASTAISKGDYKKADNRLADLTDDVVSVDERVDVPLDKARDNIALARQFMLSRNYSGAKYALKHADNALDDLSKDDSYVGRRPAIVSMRQEVDEMQQTIARNDPTLLDKADKKLQKWWNDMKSWSNNT